ncbi:MAG TPA: FtsX-like permease family protein [Jatrophihabitans sp.]|jgi:putative ABC transport system permease protein|uniref:FtsX-like permease family protein n=1 Tax=Jatrophihabitans sp. TaxID=1932789 RepID=UPI002F1E413C
MTPISPAWTALLRMGHRQVRRNRLRSVLIVALIALPVASVTLADVLIRSTPLDAGQRAEKLLGNADARLHFYDDEAIVQSLDGLQGGLNLPGFGFGSVGTGVPYKPPSTAQVRSWLPRSSLVQPERSEPAVLKTRAGATTIQLTGLDLTVAATRPALTLVAGSWSAGPAEISLSEDLARTAGLSVGDTVTLRQPAATLKLVAIVHDRYAHHYRFAAVSPATLATLVPATRSGNPNSWMDDPTSWIVVQPGGVSWSDVLELNRHGLLVTSRSVLLDPPPPSAVPRHHQQPAGGTSRSTVLIGAGVGLAVLQLALLAGPAFAVSARRRQHDLALIAAIGGDRKVLRRTLLVESLVLGAVAGGLGCALGIATAVAYRGWHDGILGPLRLHPAELAGIAVLGLCSAMAGALLPAQWAARLDVVAALSGRRGVTRTPWRLSLLGLLAVGAGLLVWAIGMSRGEVLVILPGLALCELGVLALTPGLLRLAGRLAPRLPVAVRIALRDAARSRSAAVPALAAVLAVTIASTAIAIYLSSVSARERMLYRPQLPSGVALVRIPVDRPDAAPPAGKALATHLDTRRTAVLNTPGGCSDCGGVSVLRPEVNRCPEPYNRQDLRCQDAEVQGYVAFDSPVLVLDPDQLAVLVSGPDPADVAALRAGSLLLTSALDLTGPDHAVITSQADTEPGTLRVPAAVLRSATDFHFSAVMSSATAAKLRFQVVPIAVIAQLAGPATGSQEEALTAALADNDLQVQIEHGYVDDFRAGLLATLLAALIIAMGATVLATALAVVDSRPELATLWAIGASPGLRRRLSVARAGVVALLGVLVGTALGFLPPLVVIDARRRTAGPPVDDPYPLSIPWWPSIIGTAVLIPLAAMLIAGLMTRARPPEPLRAGSAP